ncbi:hypothetical protein ACAG21_02900 [Mycobacterium sp. pR1184]
MSEAGHARRREIDMPALRKARLSARVDGVVRPVLAAPPTKVSAPHLCVLR